MSTPSEIRIPTLDELEKWWLEHPQAVAITTDERCCLIGVPLSHQYPDFDLAVFPHFHHHEPDFPFGLIRAYGPDDSLFDEPTIRIPLTEAASATAVAFDGLADGFTAMPAETCIALIREMKEAMG